MASAESVVRAANTSRPQSPPFAVLVTLADPDTSDPDCLRLSPQEAIRYRHGNRLAVVHGRHPDLASFVQAFREEVGTAYPKDARPGTALAAVAREAVGLVLEKAHASQHHQYLLGQPIETLETCLRLLANTYEGMNSGTMIWNTYWFHHVSIGLDYLVATLADLVEHHPNADLQSALLTSIPAALALPQSPAALTPRNVSDAIEAWWGDREAIEGSTQLLRHHPDTQPAGSVHPLQRLDWSRIGQVFATDGYDNEYLAFQASPGDGVSRVSAFSALTPSQFMNPSGSFKDSSLEVTLANGTPLGPSDHIRVPALIPCLPEAVTVGAVKYFRSHELRVTVPTQGLSASEPLLGLTIDCSLGGSLWRATREPEINCGDDGEPQVVLVGEVLKKASLKDTSRKVTLRARAVGNPGLAASIGTGSPLDVILLPAQAPAVVIMPLNGNRLGSAKCFSGASLADGEEGVEFGDEQTHFVAVIHHPDDSVEFANRPLQPWVAGVNVAAGVVQPTDLDILRIGDVEIECHGYEADEDFQSPVIAAASKSLVSSKIRPEALDTIRGDYEALVADLARTGQLSSCLAHCIVTEEESEGPLQTASNPDLACRIPPQLGSRWHTLTDFTVPKAISDSAEWYAFCDAFSRLGISESLVGEGELSAAEWPSRTSWRHLWDDCQPELSAYLDSYVALVDRAVEIADPAALFWASYPFSISVWKTEPFAECTAVLLSPLHPVRLAWLASVESAVWKAADAHALLGLVEGWNLPLFGANHAHGAQMIAIPMDDGPGQVFLGWSMLVNASTTNQQPVSTPVRMAGRASPGASASGLNGAAVDEALTTFRRINPHVTTLTIDLAAQAPTTRLREIDLAVLDAAAKWGSSSGSARAATGALTGGVRIWDSLNRSEDAPVDEVSRLLAEDKETPLTWSRYEFQPTRPQACNLRLLQDSAISLAVSEAPEVPERNSGVVTSRPLRRYDAAVEPDSSTTYPGVRTDCGWAPWARALQAIEGIRSTRTKVMRARVRPGLLAAEHADWTVSGEALVDPGAISRMLTDATHGSQMLWEWRPPVLAANRNRDRAERRPYISVVRVPPSFRNQVMHLLGTAGRLANPEAEATRVLQTLGGRGIGLSSLIAIGGTHAQGAIGFYLALRLMEAITVGGDDILVLPIDACDSFLRALAGETRAESSLRRADLLMIRLADQELVLAPIEIKFYPSTAWDHAGLSEAISQVGSTGALLRHISRRQRENQDVGTEGDQSLWQMALATLVETGLKLRARRGGDAESISRRLRGVAEGTSGVRIGHPLITYFGAPATSTSAQYAALSSQADKASGPVAEYGVLKADAGAVLAALGTSGALEQDWGRLVGWALSEDTTLSVGEPAVGDETELVEGPAVERSNETADAIQQSSASADGPASDGGPAGVHSDWPHPEEVLPPQPDSQATQPHPPLPTAARIRYTGARFSVGTRLDSIGSASAEYWPGNTDLTQLNVGVLGDLGTGKTQLLQTVVHELRRTAGETQENPFSVLILDYKSDFRSTRFLDSVGGAVLLPKQIPLNVFALDGRTPYDRARAFINVIERIYSGVGHVQKQRLQEAILACFETAGGEPTLGEVYAEYRSRLNGGADSVTSILDTFVMGQIFSEDRAELRSFQDLLDGRVLVLALKELGLDQDAKNALVALFLNFYYEYMLKSDKWPFEGGSPQLRRLNSYLLIDEASNIMPYGFQALEQILVQGREFGIGVILSAQYLSQFRAKAYNYAEPLRTWFIHRVPQLAASELRNLGLVNANDQLVSRIQTQLRHQCYFRSLNFDGSFIRGLPFYELDPSPEP